MFGDIGSCTAHFRAACPIIGARITSFLVQAHPRFSIVHSADGFASPPPGDGVMTFSPTRIVDVAEFSLK
jgi:hypothetical protein